MKRRSPIAVRRALNTRKVYTFEEHFEYKSPSLPMRVLRRFARRVWAAESLAGRPFPSVVAGRGTPGNGKLVSYCDGPGRIVLSRPGRTIVILLHELCHALAPRWDEEDHGAAFQRRLAGLWAKYL